MGEDVLSPGHPTPKIIQPQNRCPSGATTCGQAQTDELRAADARVASAALRYSVRGPRATGRGLFPSGHPRGAVRVRHRCFDASLARRRHALARSQNRRAPRRSRGPPPSGAAPSDRRAAGCLNARVPDSGTALHLRASASRLVDGRFEGAARQGLYTGLLNAAIELRAARALVSSTGGFRCAARPTPLTHSGLRRGALH